MGKRLISEERFMDASVVKLIGCHIVSDFCKHAQHMTPSHVGPPACTSVACICTVLSLLVHIFKSLDLCLHFKKWVRLVKIRTQQHGWAV